MLGGGHYREHDGLAAAPFVGSPITQGLLGVGYILRERCHIFRVELQGEGTGSGKVLDDPGWGRTSAIVALYKRVNVVVVPDHPAPTCGCETDGTYWNTYVDPSAPLAVYNGYIDIIHTFPFAETGRVPTD